MPLMSDENERRKVQNSFNGYSGYDNLKGMLGLNKKDPMSDAIAQKREKNKNQDDLAPEVE